MYAAEAIHVCEFCFGPLEVAYDHDAQLGTVTRESIAAGPLNMWRYADLLPVSAESPVDLGTGFTPLILADRLAAEIGLGEVWVKDDTRNPTGSFKDRVVGVALTKARELGFRIAACASTGNLANSVAAHAARAGMESFVFVPHDLEAVKLITTAVFGGHLVAVDGSYDDVNRLCAELASEFASWAFVNVNIRPYYAEGSKTLAFEVAEQLGWQLPDHVVVPIASGSQLTKIDKGFRELTELGLVDGDRGQALDDREVACDRQPGRRLVRPRGGTAQRRCDRGSHRRGDRRGDPLAGPHRGDLRRDRGGRHRGNARQAGRRRYCPTQ